MLAAKESSQSWPTNTEKCQDIDTNDNRASADSSEAADQSDNDEYGSDAIDSGGEDESSDVIFAFINIDEEDANERPNPTRSGQTRAITRRYVFCNEQLSVV